MTNIILCGGNGTRLWPLSRTLMPKQFVQLFGGKSLFELTFKRNAKFCNKTLIVSNEEQYFLALDQLEGDLEQNRTYLLEPSPRNTAAAITLASLFLPKDELVLVSPSDHLIKNEKAYQKVVDEALEFAKLDKIVTFGIVPSYAETGYGYIKFKNSNDVEAFIEKPNLQKAKEFLKEKNFLWNSGMFVFRVGFFLEQMQKYANEIYTASLKAYENAKKHNDFIKINIEDMQKIPSLSIDYALMEKMSELKVIPSDISWSDVGSFESLAKEFKDNYSNTLGEFLDSTNNFVYSSDTKKFIALIDIEDLIVVDTKDALLVAKKTSSQKVKQVFELIKDNEDLCKNHLTTHRPWGTYTILETKQGYKIKRIEVKPGKRLSLQKHFHRNEHWIVLSGTASVEVNDEKKLVRPNESIYIRMGETHRLGNEGKIPVVLIEVQVGEYTNEDDIVRIEDDFKRS